MNKGRMEAFSDGVIAIIITIMVLELTVPHGEELSGLRPLLPVFLSYVMSFVYVGIYWNNHHHMLQAVHHVDGRILWANLHLLFWLSLVPFVTAWMGENHFGTWPIALYGIVLLMAGIAYSILCWALIKRHGKNSTLAVALGKDTKAKASVMLYAMAIGLAFVSRQLTLAIYVLVSVMWLIPDRRIEKTLAGPHDH